MAFVLVQHLAPDHVSILCELIRRYTSMQVFEVDDGMQVEINCVYVIPPNRDMALLDGRLQLIDPHTPHSQRLPIDYFFQSLALDQHERAVGIVLSGTASDGTLGLSAIKGEGGLVMAQSPDSAEFDGMPRSAIATGLMDDELPPGEMPAKLLAYAADAIRNPIRLTAAPMAAPGDAKALEKILILLRSHTGHDFSQYKPGTIIRRIVRRMAVQGIETIDNYAKYLQEFPAEGGRLFHDLLIGVTNFFRDPETFQCLEELGLPKLFEGKPPGSTIRVWSVGCATGEEAYSLAILMQERMEALGQSHTLQIFATDIDDRAIATARAALYPTSIAADITPARLKRFFTPESDGSAYHVVKSIRDLLIFSEHDLIKDPPFSKIDLVSCRNLLIYLNADLQKRIFQLFHYTLNTDGMLFLGPSETVGGVDDLFATLARHAKLYRRKDNRFGTRRRVTDQLIASQPLLNANHPQFTARTAPAMKLSPRELAEKAMVQQIVQASALVNGRGDILYIHGRTGRYLELAPGDGGISNILKTAREGLRNEMALALHKAAQGKEVVVSPGVRVKTNGSFTTINLTVSPVLAEPSAMPDEPLYLVILEEAPKVPKGGGQMSEDRGQRADARVMELNKKLRKNEKFLQSSLEGLGSSTEELRSANEEMQSVNEELQSSNEELETAKEELQSSNEELHTVNNELQNRVADLAQANNDINNLLAGTGIGTLFVDHQLRILRFTPPIAEIISVTPEDAGRSVCDFSNHLKNYSTLGEDVRAVLSTLVPIEREVRTTQDKWYLLRILPYRTTENIIQGAVISFVDITEHNRAKELLRTSEEDFAMLAESVPQIVWITRPDGWNIYFNQQWVDYTGLTLEESCGHGWNTPFHPDDRQRAWDAWQEATQKDVPYALECRLRRTDGVYRWWLIRGVPHRNVQGEIVKWFGTCTDIEDIKVTQAALTETKALLQAAMDQSPAGIAIADAPGGQLRYVNRAGLLIRGASEAEALTGVDAERYVASWKLLHLDGTPMETDEVPLARAILFGEECSKEFIIRRSANEDRIVLANAAPILDDAGRVTAGIVVFHDVTERKQAEEALRESEAMLKGSQRIVGLGSYVFNLASDLWNSSEVLDTIFGIDATYERSAVGWAALIHPDDRAMMTEYFHQEVIERHQPFDKQYRIVRRNDQAERWLHGQGELEFDTRGRPVKMVGTILDITERKRTEDALHLALTEKTALVKEIHHRVKNNLAIMASLINMQVRQIKHPEALAALDDTKARLLSMSLLHEMLYRSGRMDRVDVKGYLESLCAHLKQSLGMSAQGVQIHNRLPAALTMEIDQAVPCGLIVSELVSNAIKHAFPEARHGKIMVELVVEEPDSITLRVADNGIGLPETLSIDQAGTVGFTLVNALTQQLGGMLYIRRERGTLFEIHFPFRPPILS